MANRRSWPVVRPRSPCRRASGNPVSWAPISVIASAARLDLVGDGVQESGTILSAGVAEADRTPLPQLRRRATQDPACRPEIMRRSVRGFGAGTFRLRRPVRPPSGACHAACLAFVRRSSSVYLPHLRAIRSRSPRQMTASRVFVRSDIGRSG